MATKANGKKASGRTQQRSTSEQSKRQYVSQADVPGLTLDQALRVGVALADNFAGKAAKPVALAQALGMSPSAGTFRLLCGASIAYGITEGGAFSDSISLTPLGKRITMPTKEGDEALARRDAFLRPRIVREFLTQYDQAKLPRPDIARNVLVEMKVPKDAADRTFSLIVEGAGGERLLRDIKGDKYVDLDGVSPVDKTPATSIAGDADDSVLDPTAEPRAVGESDDDESDDAGESTSTEMDVNQQLRRKRVFIAHGKNRTFVEPIKKLLGFGELEPVVSTERSSVSIPIPEKVMGEMRSCGSAIIHVDAELSLIDKEAKEHKLLNPNVLIEIGASMALYGQRFILLVREGITLPSDLQGLHEVRYSGDALDGAATIRLLEAINDIKNHPLPLM